MPEKYLAVALKRIDLDESDRIYIPDGLTAGDIDPDTNILRTYTGFTYKPITDYSENDETVKGYYYNLIETKDISTAYEDHHAFEEQYKNTRFFTSKSDDLCIVRSFDKETEKQRLLSSIGLELDDGAETVITASSLEMMPEKVEVDENMLTETIRSLVSQVVDDKFTPDELIDLAERLEDVREEAEMAIESIHIQQEQLESELDEISSPPPTKVPTPGPLKDSQTETSQINIPELYSKITKTLIAQDSAARRTIVEISRLIDKRIKDKGILLTGDSGVGKTLLMNLISAYINRPILKIDSTQLTAPSYVGRSLEQYLWNLYVACGKNKELAESAIVYFDEIDKKGSDKKNDSNGKSVQDILLKFIEGTEYIASENPQQVTQNTSIPINTQNMIVVASGAFLDVYNKKHNSASKRKIGFQPCCSEDTTSTPSQNKEPSVEDFVNIGKMSKELMGRLPTIIHLDDLNTASIAKIIKESDNSELRQQEEVFNKRKVKLTTKEGYILAIAEQAFDRKIGARGITKLINDSTWHAYDQICCEPNVYEEVILTEETAKDPTNYQLVKRKSPTTKKRNS